MCCTLPALRGGNSTCLDFENLAGQIFSAGASFEENWAGSPHQQLRRLFGRDGLGFRPKCGGAIWATSCTWKERLPALNSGAPPASPCAWLKVRTASSSPSTAAPRLPTIFPALTGSSLGGVVIAISNGEMTIFGEIGTLEIGGTSLFLDHICVIPCFAGCIDFETQTGGAEFF